MELAHADAAPLPPRASPVHYLLAIVLAILGGGLGIAGAFFEELRASFSPLLIIIGAPIIEEVLKPSGVYIGLARWTCAYTNQLWIALLSALAGLTFGVLESVIYVTVYNPHHTHAFLVYRFTVTVALHAVASFIAGWGINQRLLEWAGKGGAFPRASRNAFVAAMVLHALYNATAVALSIAGVLDFS